MFRNTRGGLSRPAHLTSLQLPEYSLPDELEAVLDVNDQSKLSRESKLYAKVLEVLSTVKYVDLSENHYVQLLKLALYLEEYQSNEEMKKRKLFKQKIRRLFNRNPDEILFKIRVKDLDEERPWIRENDFVDVIDTRTYRSYTLKVTYVTKTDIVASDDGGRLCKVFKPWHLYNINFRFQNYPLRCAHYALWVTYKQSVITYLFPHKSKSFVKDENETYGELTMLNPNIEMNPEQKQAVIHIVNKSSFPAPYILYGPPGTGKTATLVEAICQIHKASPLTCILVCTPSNTAADEVAKRLLKFIPTHKIYRIYSQAKNRSTIDEELKNCSYCGGEEKNPLTRQDIAGKAILVSTLCTATRFLLMKLNTDYFSHIIIDEAGQGTEADMLIPISIASKDGKLHSQVVLAGDPQQLGPTVISKLADIILGRSILERLMSYDTYQKDCKNEYNPKYITKLLNNYRSNPNIIHISNKLFYDNELVPKVPNTDKNANFPVVFHGVEGIEEKDSYSPSTFNCEEIGVVLKYVYDLIGNKTEFGKVSAKDIGIITPFTLQSKRIKKLLKKRDDEEKKKLDEKEKNPEEKRKLDEKEKKPEEKKKLKNKKSKKGITLKKDDRRTSETSNCVSTDIEIKLKSENVKLHNIDPGNEENKFQRESRSDDPSTKTDDAKIELQNKIKKDSEADSNDKNEIKLKNLKDINVGTVELFQGQERKIMIMTAVRSKTFFHDGKEHIGFLSNPKRFNVAMTRAQDALIVIGNPGILQKDGMWQYLLKYCMENKSYRGLEFELKASSNERPDISESETITSSASLFKKQQFKLFKLDESDSWLDIRKTVDAFVEPEEDELERRAKSQLCDKFQNLRLSRAYF